MDNYKLIFDEEMLETFIAWLPELGATERYYMTLMARRKYCAALNMADMTTKRIVCKKEDIFNKIRQLEVPLGSYVTKLGVAVPQEALALYINVNPRSMVVAAKNTAKTLIDLICEDRQIAMNPKSIALTEIHKARGTKHFVDIDIDSPELTIEDVIKRAQEVLNRDAFSIIKTRGGVHIIVETKKAERKDWFRGLRDRFVFDVTGDNMVPVPGAFQGGHVPVFSANCVREAEVAAL